MEQLITKIFGIIYILMILNPIFLYVLKRKKLYLFNIGLVGLYLINWFWMIGRVGYDGVLRDTWIFLLYLCIVFFFISLTITFTRYYPYRSFSVLVIIYVFGLILVSAINIKFQFTRKGWLDSEVAIYTSATLLSTFIVAFLVTFFMKNKKT